MKYQLQRLIVLVLFVALAAGCGVVNQTRSNRNTSPSSSGDAGNSALQSPNGNADAAAQEGALVNQATSAPVKIDKSQFKLAKEIKSETWINSEKINWENLRGKVVVVDFWTFACYNCKNTLPFKKDWHKNYADQGLVILGVHTPELSFEKDVENVRKAVKEYGLEYPIAIDGDFANWNRYNVRAWPTWFIVDKEGYVRYSHIGEGDYTGSEKMIQQLLAE